MNAEQYLCELTQRFWRYYVLDPTEENFERIVRRCSEDIVMIGTGKHEIYTDASKIAANMQSNLSEAAHIRFDVLDEWYDALTVREDVVLVYGGIWVREHSEEAAAALVEMDTRFSVLYEREADGAWKIVHLHHSIPYFDQSQNEYYPKALSAKVREALDLVEVFKKKSETDLMTGVYNHESFQKQVESLLQSGKPLFYFILDLDHFKTVNDTCGHETGDSLLKLLAELMKRHFDGGRVLGRLGGDEFGVCAYAGDRKACEETLSALREEFMQAAKSLPLGGTASFSVGLAESEPGMSYSALYRRADEALYRAKNEGRDARRWYGA